jgi:malate dehydrogenase
MTRLDHNRALAQLAKKAGVSVSDITKMTIWGNHSATQYPDIFHAEVGDKNAAEAVGDDAWLRDTFIPTVAKRGAAIIEARGASSAASAASAAVDHVHTWTHGTPEGDWTSAAVVSDGSYGVPEGLISSFPVVAKDGRFEIVQGLEIDDFSRERIDASVRELTEERDAVAGLGLISPAYAVGGAGRHPAPPTRDQGEDRCDQARPEGACAACTATGRCSRPASARAPGGGCCGSSCPTG